MDLNYSHRSPKNALWFAALLLLSPASSVFGQPFTGMVVFGDSLSDPGNHFIKFGVSARQPFAPIPEASYDIGGHHFSNGATWVEQVATAMNMPTSGGPALRAATVFTNYALGRARARACTSTTTACPDGAYPVGVVDLGFEVTQFLSDFAQSAPSGNLYVLWIGGNDIDDALNALQTDTTGVTSVAIITAAVNAEAANLQKLYGAGARTFLVPGAVNFALAPFVRSLGPFAQFLATQFAGAYDAGLGQVIAAMSALPGIKFIGFDGNAVFAAIEANPRAFGITDALDSCLSFGVIGNAICPMPNKHLFWDGIHPTAAGHSLLAASILQAISCQESQGRRIFLQSPLAFTIAIANSPTSHLTNELRGFLASPPKSIQKLTQPCRSQFSTLLGT
jgi:phospholipase/lecithinase/hemolysin